MPVLYPVAAPLHNKEAVERIVKTYCKTLNVERVGNIPPEGVVLVLVCTGGTERLVLDGARINPHIILLAHEKQNSLPAALESLAALKTRGIFSRIVFGLDDASLSELKSAIKVLKVVEALKKSRIGIFGFPSPWLNLPNFSRAERLFGVKFVHIDLSQVVKEVSHSNPAGITLEADTECTKDHIKNALTLYQAIKTIAERESLQALGIKCFDLITLLNTTGCLAVSLLNDKGVTTGCEADIPATITMFMIQLLTGTPTFMGNPCSVSGDKVLLAHCTIATTLVNSFVLTPHFESATSVSIQGTLSKGPVTLAALDAEFKKMLLAEGEILESVPLLGLCRTQVSVELKNAKELLKKALGNHLVLSPGKHKRILKEVSTYYNLDVVEL